MMTLQDLFAFSALARLTYSTWSGIVKEATKTSNLHHPHLANSRNHV